MTVVIGIDGGATHTRGVMADSEGRVLAVAKDSASNLHHGGVENAAGVIARIVADLCNRADEETAPASIACGLAGVGRPDDHQQMLAELEKRFQDTPVLLVTDADTALTGGSLTDSGIIVIAGTGSIVYGRNREGEGDRVGGHGSLLSDEGSGYALAVAGMRAMMHAHDGLEPETAITQKVLDLLDRKSVDEVVTWSLQSGTDKEEIARMANAVLDAFVAGDPLAQRVIVDQADFLAAAVNVLHRRLGLEPAISVVLAGGVFKHCDAYAGLLTRKIRYYLPAAKVGPPRLPPVLGAAMYALSQTGVQVTHETIRRLSDTFAPMQSSLEDA